jgi:hypothetical protein
MTGLFLIRAVTHIRFQTGFGQIFGRNCRKPAFSCVGRFRNNGLRRRFDPGSVAQIAKEQKLAREWKPRQPAAQIQLFWFFVPLNELEVVDRSLSVTSVKTESRHVRVNGGQAFL